MIDVICDSATLPVIGAGSDPAVGINAEAGRPAFADALTLLMGGEVEQPDIVEDAAAPIAKEESSEQKTSDREPILMAMAMPQPLNPRAVFVAPVEMLVQHEQGFDAQPALGPMKPLEQQTLTGNNRTESPAISVSMPNFEPADVSVDVAAPQTPAQAPTQTVPREIQAPTEAAEQLISTLEPELDPMVQSRQQEPAADNRVDASDDSQAPVPVQTSSNTVEAAVGRRAVVSQPVGNEPSAQVTVDAQRVTTPRVAASEIEHFAVVEKSVSTEMQSAKPVREAADVQQSDGHAAAMSLQAETRPVTGEQRPIVDSTNSSDLHVRVIRQVVQQIKMQHIDGGSNLLVRLNPPDLGSLQLQVQRNSDGITTHIETSNSRVQGLLEAHLPLLIDSLAQAGVRMDSVSVSVAAGFSSLADHSRRQDAQSHTQRPRHNDVSSLSTAGIQIAADAAIHNSWASMRQSAHSWLA